MARSERRERRVAVAVAVAVPTQVMTTALTAERAVLGPNSTLRTARVVAVAVAAWGMVRGLPAPEQMADFMEAAAGRELGSLSVATAQMA